VPGAAGAKHTDEIGRFADVAASDGINISSTTYQDVIFRLLREVNSLPERERDQHANYLDYVAERYL
jgi:hypothetical protein